MNKNVEEAGKNPCEKNSEKCDVFFKIITTDFQMTDLRNNPAEVLLTLQIKNNKS